MALPPPRPSLPPSHSPRASDRAGRTSPATTDDWADRAAPMRAAVAAAAAAAAATPPPPPAPLPSTRPSRTSRKTAQYVDNFDDEAYARQGYPYAYTGKSAARRSSGAGAFAILGFLALGVLALLGGAVLAGVFGGDPSTGAVDPTLTPSPTLVREPRADAARERGAKLRRERRGERSPAASGEPVVFPDGFTAETQPCVPGSADLDGCDSNGTSNSGTVWVWVGFQNGTEADVLAAIVAGPDSGTVVGEGAIALERIGCAPTCRGGWYLLPVQQPRARHLRGDGRAKRRDGGDDDLHGRLTASRVAAQWPRICKAMSGHVAGPPRALRLPAALLLLIVAGFVLWPRGCNRPSGRDSRPPPSVRRRRRREERSWPHRRHPPRDRRRSRPRRPSPLPPRRPHPRRHLRQTTSPPRSSSAARSRGRPATARSRTCRGTWARSPRWFASATPTAATR